MMLASPIILSELLRFSFINTILAFTHHIPPKCRPDTLYRERHFHVPLRKGAFS
jgi:hypothetical protein